MRGWAGTLMAGASSSTCSAILTCACSCSAAPGENNVASMAWPGGGGTAPWVSGSGSATALGRVAAAAMSAASFCSMEAGAPSLYAHRAMSDATPDMEAVSVAQCVGMTSGKPSLWPTVPPAARASAIDMPSPPRPSSGTDMPDTSALSSSLCPMRAAYTLCGRAMGPYGAAATCPITCRSSTVTVPTTCPAESGIATVLCQAGNQMGEGGAQPGSGTGGTCASAPRVEACPSGPGACESREALCKPSRRSGSGEAAEASVPRGVRLGSGRLLQPPALVQRAPSRMSITSAVEQEGARSPGQPGANSGSVTGMVAGSHQSHAASSAPDRCFVARCMAASMLAFCACCRAARRAASSTLVWAAAARKVLHTAPATGRGSMDSAPFAPANLCKAAWSDPSAGPKSEVGTGRLSLRWAPMRSKEVSS